MKKELIFMFCCCIFIASCNKNNSSPQSETTPCLNITQYINDTLIALITCENSEEVGIYKVQNGIFDTLLNNPSYEYWDASLNISKTKFVCLRSPTSNGIKYNDPESDLYLYNVYGTNEKLLIDYSANGFTGLLSPEFAPDNFHVVFSACKLETDGNYHWNIYITDTNGTTPIKMNTRLGRFLNPSFAKGSMTQLVYSAIPLGSSTTAAEFFCEIHTAVVSGTYTFLSESRLTNNLDYEYSPSFSFTNDAIAYCQTASPTVGSPVKIMRYDFFSSSNNSVFDNGGINENVVWCAANNNLYFISKNSYCFYKISAISAAGTSNAVVYQKTNNNMRLIEIK